MLTVTNVILSALSLLAIVVFLNYLSSRHPLRVKWSPHFRFELSSATRAVLEQLTDRIDIVVYTDRQAATALHTSIDLLLEEYAWHCPRIRLRHVDYIRDRTTAQSIVQSHDLAGQTATDLIIFAAGQRRSVVTVQELRDYQIGDQIAATLKNEPSRLGFHGESLFTSAIWRLHTDRSLRVAYLIGHGEHDPESQGAEGYREFQQILQAKGFDFASHHLLKDGPLPQDTDLVVIAGPRYRFSDPELSVLDEYLNSGGRLLALFHFNGLSNPSGVEEWLRNWGLDVGRNIIEDVSLRLGSDLAVMNFADHPVTTPLVKAELGLQMYLPRTVMPLPAPNRTGFGLAFTSPEGIARPYRPAGSASIRTPRGSSGPLPVLAAVEIPIAEPNPDGETKTARILAAGDSSFWGNHRIHQLGNRDFLTLTTGWLTDQFGLIQGIGPQPLYRFQLPVTDRQLGYLAGIMLGLGPGSALAVGLIVWWRQRTE